MASRHGQLELTWGDGPHVFRLAIGEIRELQEKTGCGPMELVKRMIHGTWRIDDIRETVRLGLIGGGLDPIKSLSLVARYVDQRPLAESVPVAQAVLSVLLFGGDEEDRPAPPKDEAATSSQMGGSRSPRSTELVQ